jgi:hypothetical protein
MILNAAATSAVFGVRREEDTGGSYFCNWNGPTNIESMPDE